MYYLIIPIEFHAQRDCIFETDKSESSIFRALYQVPNISQKIGSDEASVILEILSDPSSDYIADNLPFIVGLSLFDGGSDFGWAIASVDLNDGGIMIDVGYGLRGGAIGEV